MKKEENSRLAPKYRRPAHFRNAKDVMYSGYEEKARKGSIEHRSGYGVSGTAGVRGKWLIFPYWDCDGESCDGWIGKLETKFSHMAGFLLGVF